MRTVPQPSGWFSVGGLASKRNSHPLTQRVCVPAPSLHSRYLLLRYCRPVRLPDGAASRVMHSPRALAALPATRRASQVPRLICPHAPSPTTPESPVVALAPYFTTGRRLRHVWQLGRSHFILTRPNRFRLRYGSRVRLARLRQTDCSVPRSLGYLLNGQLQGKLLSAYKISQAYPGAPYNNR